MITNAESSTLTIDGRPVYGSVPAFERAGEAHGSTYVVRAELIGRRALAGRGSAAVGATFAGVVLARQPFSRPGRPCG